MSYTTPTTRDQLTTAADRIIRDAAAYTAQVAQQGADYAHNSALCRRLLARRHPAGDNVGAISSWHALATEADEEELARYYDPATLDGETARAERETALDIVGEYVCDHA